MSTKLIPKTKKVKKAQAGAWMGYGSKQQGFSPVNMSSSSATGSTGVDKNTSLNPSTNFINNQQFGNTGFGASNTYNNNSNLYNTVYGSSGYQPTLNTSQTFGGYSTQPVGFDAVNVNAVPQKQEIQNTSNAGSGFGLISAFGELGAGVTKTAQSIVADQYEKDNPTTYTSRGIKQAETSKQKLLNEEVMKSQNTGSWFGDMIMGLYTGLDLVAGGGNELLRKERQRSYTENLAATNKEKRAQYAQLAKEGMKLKTSRLLDSFNKKEKVIPRFQLGGSLAINIIPKGKLHKENNNIGDKGIPVVTPEGEKKFEIEKEEFILNLKSTKQVEDLVEAYNESGNSDLLISLGKLMAGELLHNTKDNSEKFLA